MATAATAGTIPLEEYLHTSYEHDCEWVDGELRERAMPDDDHSAIQAFFMGYFLNLKRELHVRVRAELRIQVAATKYRIPDVTLMPDDAPRKLIPDTPPFLCIEILSPDDRAGELQEKLNEYVMMGVKAIWVVDPRQRRLWTADVEGMHMVSEFRVPGLERVITPAEIFAELDSL